jgi:hypothetical protein
MSDLQKNFNDILAGLALAGLAYEQDIARLTAERDNLTVISKWQTTTIAELRETNIALTGQVAELQPQVNSLTIERDTTIADQATRIAQGNAALSVADMMIRSLEAERDALKTQLAERIAALDRLNDELYDQIFDLERKLFRLEHPADVYVTVDTSQGRVNHLRQGLAIVTNEFFYAPASAAVPTMAPYIADLYDQVSYHLSGGFGTLDAWEWNPANGPRPTKPTNLGSLRNMVNLVNRFGRPHLLTLYRDSWHLKRQRGRALTYAEAWGPGSAETGRLSGEFKDDHRLLISELCFTAATEILKADPNARIDCEVHNEFKGFWELLNKDVVIRGQNWADGENPGTPGYGDIDMGPYYALTAQAALAGFARANLPRERVRFGGPYAVLQSKGKRDVDALPVGHPLADRPWGSMTKQPIYAVERFLAYVKKYNLPLDYLVVDGGTHNKDNVFLTDAWGQLGKLEEANLYLRYLCEQAGMPNLPIWWAERYFNERPAPGTTTITAEQDSMERRCVVTLAGLGAMAWSGAALAFQWGLRGEDGEPFFDKNYKENAAYFRADGTPTALYEACLAFKRTFPAGSNIYPLIFEGDGVGGWGSDVGAIVWNKMNVAKTVCVGDTVYSLAPHGWVAV